MYTIEQGYNRYRNNIKEKERKPLLQSIEILQKSPPISEIKSQTNFHGGQSHLGMEDSGEYIKQSTPSSLPSPNTNYKFVSLQLLLGLTLISSFFFYSKLQSSTLDQKQIELMKYREKYFYVNTQKGARIRLNYLEQQVLLLQKVQQIDLDLIEIPETEQFNNFLGSFSDQSQISSMLVKDIYKEEYKLFQAEFQLLNRKYNLNKHISERQICVISPFKNKVSSSKSWQNYLYSINMQNYSNYKVYMIDDLSQDNSTLRIIQQAKKNFPRLNNRMTILNNTEWIGPLGNRDSAIRNFCAKGSIVIQIDGDDALIGKQVFNVVNRLYDANKEAWFMYFNFLYIQKSEEEYGSRGVNFQSNILKGFCKKIEKQTFETNKYRTSVTEWVTSSLRTYLRDLYVKIPIEYLLEGNSRTYYLKASDRFTMYALVELAGEDHTFFYNEYFYFYFQPNYILMQKSGCTLPELLFYEQKSRIQTPLKSISRLDESQLARKQEHYIIPSKIVKLYKQRQKQYYDCLQKQSEDDQQRIP